MAIVSSIIGSMFGLLSFLASLAFLDLGFWYSLLVYSASGTAATLVVLSLFVLRGPMPPQQPDQATSRQPA